MASDDDFDFGIDTRPVSTEEEIRKRMGKVQSTATKIRQETLEDVLKSTNTPKPDPACDPAPSGAGYPAPGNTLNGPKFPAHRYRDADEFDRETADGDKVDFEYRPDSDELLVRHRRSGNVYRMTATQARARDLSPSRNWIDKQRIKDHLILIDPAQPQAKVHVMHQGQALCHFDNRRPVDWPKGHEWVSLDAYKTGVGISCYDCCEAVRHLLEP